MFTAKLYQTFKEWPIPYLFHWLPYQVIVMSKTTSTVA